MQSDNPQNLRLMFARFNDEANEIVRRLEGAGQSYRQPWWDELEGLTDTLELRRREFLELVDHDAIIGIKERTGPLSELIEAFPFAPSGDTLLDRSPALLVCTLKAGWHITGEAAKHFTPMQGEPGTEAVQLICCPPRHATRHNYTIARTVNGALRVFYGPDSEAVQIAIDCVRAWQLTLKERLELELAINESGKEAGQPGHSKNSSILSDDVIQVLRLQKLKRWQGKHRIDVCRHVVAETTPGLNKKDHERSAQSLARKVRRAK